MPRTFTKSVRHLWRLFGRKPAAEKVDLTGRQVIVTGASPGSLGYETARVLAGWGACVRGDMHTPCRAHGRIP